MNHTKITAAVYDQTLTFEELPMLASGGVDEVQIALTFDSLWDGLEKTAVFYRKLGAVYHIPIDESGTVVVPCEVMKTKGCFWFGVFGENEAGTVRTTEVKQVNVVQGATIENEAGYEPAPDIYAEILAAAKNAESIAQSVRDDADAGKFGGGGSVPSKLPNPYPLSVNGTKYDGSELVLLSLMRWMGEWTNSTTYYANDVVSYNGNLYVCIANNVPNDDMPSDLVSWVYLAKNGEIDIPAALPNPHALTFTGAAEGTYDGSAPLSVEIPAGGASEWKRLTRIEVAEDEVEYFHITEDENGEAFSATDFTIRIKAVQRTAVSSIKIGVPTDPFHLSNSVNSNRIAQLNAFGNTGGVRYYTFQLTHEGDWRKTFFSESNADIFSTADNSYAVANNVYASGVTYAVGNLKFPVDGLVIFATNKFFTGDIIEVWYK